MRAANTQKWAWMSGVLTGVLLVWTGCDQDPPLAPTCATEAAQVQVGLVFEPSAKLAAGDEVRVLVWHVRDLDPLVQDPVGKRVQLPDIDFDPNDWLAWAAYLQQRLGLNENPERSAVLRIERELARGSLRVRAGEKHLFVGRFRSGTLTHTGEARVVALPGKVNAAVVEIAPFELESPLEFSSAGLAAAVREKAGSLLPGDVASLRVLDASGRGISDLSGVEQLTGLRALDLSANQIGDVEPLAGLMGLTALDVSHNQLVDVDPISVLTSLTELDLSHNELGGIDQLDALGRLVKLNLSHNRIVDVSPLSGLADLTELDVSHNRITDVRGLAALSGLSKLDVRGNPLSVATLEEQISALESVGLEEVLFDPPEAPDEESELSPGEFADLRLSAEVAKELVRNLTSDLTKLTGLNVGGKGISSLDGIQHLTQLSQVDLAGNQLEDLSPLSGLTRLSDVDLRNNQITDISALVDNPGLGEGDRVDLRGNDLGDEALAVQIPALQERGVEVVYDGS